MAARDWPAGGGADLDWAESDAAAAPDWPVTGGAGCHGDLWDAADGPGDDEAAFQRETEEGKRLGIRPWWGMRVWEVEGVESLPRQGP